MKYFHEKFLYQKNMNIKESFVRLYLKQMRRSSFANSNVHVWLSTYEEVRGLDKSVAPTFLPRRSIIRTRLVSSLWMSRVSFLTSLKRRLSPDLKLDLGEVNLGTWRLPCNALHPLLKRRPRNAVFHPC